MRANFFSIELWYRSQLQFVREFSDFNQLISLVSTIKEGVSEPQYGDGVYKLYHCFASTEKHLLTMEKYDHKSELAINGQRLTGFMVMKNIIMSV